MGYYWPSMKKNSYHFFKKCQIHGNLIHAPAQQLQPLASPWSFCQWGLDLVGKIHPPSTNGPKFIITSTEYFTKWIKVVPLTIVTSKHIASFILNYIICHYEIPLTIINDSGRTFKNQDVKELCDRFYIQCCFSTPHYPQGNG